jgi:hypothetical protein
VLIHDLQLLFGTALLDPLLELVNAMVPLSATHRDARGVARVCELDEPSEPSIGGIAHASSRSGDAPTRLDLTQPPEMATRSTVRG